MNVAVIGMGYVGCIAAAKLAEYGHIVHGVEISQNKVDTLNNGKPTVFEPGLDELFASMHQSGRIKAHLSLNQIKDDIDIYYICVGTPNTQNGDLDLSGIYNAVIEIKGLHKKNRNKKFLFIRSTVRPGTNQKIAKALAAENISVVSNPEFLREGCALSDWEQQEYIVIGSSDKRAIDVSKKLYSSYKGEWRVVAPESAEVIKYINNSWHAVKVAFGNEIGRILTTMNIPINEVIPMFLADKKLNISPTYLKPGMPYGGSCLPKDLSGLNFLGRLKGLSNPLLASVEDSNQTHFNYLCNYIQKMGKKRIGIMGLSFKDNTDDLRNSPAMDLLSSLQEFGLNVKAYEPNLDPAKLIGKNKRHYLNFFSSISNSIVCDIKGLASHSQLIVVTRKFDSKTMKELALHYKKSVVNLSEFVL